MGLNRDDLRLERRRQRHAAAQKRRRERARNHLTVFKVAAHEHLVPLLLSTLGFGEMNDREACEVALSAWIEEQAQRVIDGSRDAEVRAQLAEIKVELVSRIKAA